MTCWNFDAEPAPSRALAAAAVVVHLAAATVPWLAACPPGLAWVLSLAALLGLVPTLRSVPGSGSWIRSVHAGSTGWSVTLAGGAAVPCRVRPATRVYRDLVILRCAAGDSAVSAVILRSTLPPDAFRRLKVRLRFDPRGKGRGGPAGRMN